MADGSARIDPLREDHREALRAACAEDDEIWEIYPTRFFGTEFDAAFDKCFGDPRSIAFALYDGDALVGMSAFLGIDEPNKALEIGRTYLAPRLRAALGAHAAAVAATSDGLQPVVALYRRNVLPRLETWLMEGNRKVGSWLGSLDYTKVMFDEQAFVNLNRPEDLI